MKRDNQGRATRSPLTLAAVLLAIALIAAVGFWAGRVTLAEPEARVESAKESSVVEVTEQQVGRTLNVNTTVRIAHQALAPNTMPGTLTELTQQDTYNAGDVLYRVNNRPVRVAPGTIPMYRDLEIGAQGQDVRALNAALSKLGHITGDVGDRFTRATATGVRAWQKALGIEQTGRVERGELVIVPSLPLAITFDSKIATLGTELVGGERLLQAPGGDPEFVMELLPQQASMIPAGATVTVKFQEYKWPAVVTGSKEGEGGATINLSLSAPDGSLVCGNDCAILPATDTQYLATDAELVPAQHGPAVPVSALTSNPDGSVVVTIVGETGDSNQPVTVLASQDGLAIVDGIKVGEKIRVFGAGTPYMPPQNPAPSTTGSEEAAPDSGDEQQEPETESSAPTDEGAAQ